MIFWEVWWKSRELLDRFDVGLRYTGIPYPKTNHLSKNLENG